MKLDLNNNEVATDAKKVLVVGFENYSYILLNENQDENFKQYQFVPVDNSFKAYSWLEERVGAGEEVAIICNYNFLREDNFNLLSSIQQNKPLKMVPFIVIADENDKAINPEQALKEGIDDCYTEPVRWNDLRERIEFLSKYKTELVQLGNMEEEDLTFKMPLGKRIFDIVFASGVVLALSPVLLAIALIIKLTSKGPIIYKSKRIGRGYQQFYFLKFRSMVVDADKKRADVAHLNNYNDKNDKTAAAFLKVKNDPRVTTIGRFIRKTSLDELPQLLNVIRGDMSIVGNRPLPLDEAKAVTRDEWARRFQAPAGITGLWQTVPTGKDTMSVEERISLDVKYAKDFSMGMDMKIISRTLPAMIQKNE